LKHLSRGFTLVELLVVIALLGIIASLAAPDLRSAIVRNKVASLSNEFATALQQARALAVSRNSCVELCMSTQGTTSTTCNGGNRPGTELNGQGWFIFENPTCEASASGVSAADVGGTVIQQRTGEGEGINAALRGTGYTISRSVGTAASVLFDPRGYAHLIGSGIFQIAPPRSVSTLNGQDYRRTICIDAAGRTTVRQYTADCS
jgi:type IV fimbrial biogenesis protein FimT